MALFVYPFVLAIFLTFFAFLFAAWLTNTFKNKRLALGMGIGVIILASLYGVKYVTDGCNACRQTDLTGLCCEWTGVGVLTYASMGIFALVMFPLLFRKFLT
ncbi:MAG: hypothetical protein CL608_04365 [Anaerolineaceae bacterium]|nr:hypothetical protein [Anaerolineaceae bacterium]